MSRSDCDTHLTQRGQAICDVASVKKPRKKIIHSRGAQTPTIDCLDNTCSNEYYPSMTQPRRPSQDKYDSLEQEAFLNLWRTYDRLREPEDSLFARYRISAQQYNTLRLLREAHPARLPTLVISDRLISRAPDITRLLDRLEARHLIERHRRPDNRRVVEVGITPAGVALLDELAEEVQQCNLRQLGHLSVAELRTLIGLLKAARMPHETAATAGDRIHPDND